MKQIQFVINNMFGVGESIQGPVFLAGGDDVVYHANKVSLPDDNNMYRFIIQQPVKDLDITIPKHQVTIIS